MSQWTCELRNLRPEWKILQLMCNKNNLFTFYFEYVIFYATQSCREKWYFNCKNTLFFLIEMKLITKQIFNEFMEWRRPAASSVNSLNSFFFFSVKKTQILIEKFHFNAAVIRFWILFNEFSSTVNEVNYTESIICPPSPLLFSLSKSINLTWNLWWAFSFWSWIDDKFMDQSWILSEISPHLNVFYIE